MSELRKQKLEALIQNESSRFFVEERHELDIESMALVDGVIVTPDLKHAQVWISFSGKTNEQAKKEFERLVKQTNLLVSYLFHRLTLRRMPQISLRLSNADKAFHLMEIFDTIRSHGRDIQSDSTDPLTSEEDNSDDAR